MSEEISLRELARRLNVANNSVTKALQNGRIKRLDNGKFLWPEVKADWQNNRDPAKIRDNAVKSLNSDTPSPAVVFLRARAKNEFLKGKKTELEIDVMEKNLIDKDYACRATFNFARVIRDMFMNMPARFAPEMAARLKVDEFALTQELDKSIRTVLNEVAECVLTFE